MKKTILLTGICIIVLLLIYFSSKNNSVKEDARGNLYAGAKACASCHSNLYNSYLHTAHFMASAPANEKTVHGSFTDGTNIFWVNATQQVVMEKLDSGLFQTYYLNNKIKERYRFDVVFGGIKGESYLSWKGNELYQLPLSYFSRERQWSTSPGYGIDFLNYPGLRSLGKQCLECHASYIDNQISQSQEFTKIEQFDKSSLVLSVDCERCHGPGAQHVDFQIKNPANKTAHFITSYRSLNRSQKLDMCAVCHSGISGTLLRSSFEFIPGDTFAKFKMPGFSQPDDANHLDVHGNQLQLLQSSQCFIKSNLDCATCHDVHQNSRGNDFQYTQTCLTCHNAPGHTYCKMTDTLTKEVLETNCISCHMPALPTKAISVQVSEKLPPIQFFIHTHRIAIYPEEVKKILAYTNK